MKAVVCDLRNVPKGAEKYGYPTSLFAEYLLGDNQPAQVLRIPPGVAHGFKVLQGPAHLFYVTSQVYNPEDEGRIPYDALGYDWFKQDIK
jgi:dTDP-4-dehydrorhamnose 3,5-epimerase